MAFKFIVLLSLMALVSAGDYEDNKPSSANNQSSGNYDTKHNGDDNSNKHLIDPTSVQHDNSYQTNTSNDNGAYDDVISSSSYASYVDNTYHPADAQAYQISNSDSYANSNYDYELNNVAYNPPAKYDYSYSVNDPTTGDIKSHSESRDGYYVRGVYSLVDPDGYKRTVTYTADNVNGFHAVVNREPYAVQYTVPRGNQKASDAVVDESGDKSKESQHNLVNSLQEKGSYSSHVIRA